MTDIFDDNATPTPNGNVDPPKPPVIPDHLKELIGEGKKYASVEKALESLPHAQQHISKIEQENAELRQKMQEALAIEEVYKKLTESMNAPPQATPAGKVLDEASIADLLEKKLSEREREKEAKANVDRVKQALTGKYGDKAKEVYEAKAKELGLGMDFLNEVVRRSPRAAEELFGIKPKDNAAPTRGSVNTDMLNNNPRPPAKPTLGPLSGGDLMSAWKRAKESVNKE